VTAALNKQTWSPNRKEKKWTAVVYIAGKQGAVYHRVAGEIYIYIISKPTAILTPLF